MLGLLLTACTHQRPATVAWSSFDPDERRAVAAGHKPFEGSLEVGATYEAFAAVQQDTVDPRQEGKLLIVASRYEPEYFPGAIRWRNETDALDAVTPGEWQSIVFDVVTVTESAVERGGAIVWVPEYECDIEALVPVPGVLVEEGFARAGTY